MSKISDNVRKALELYLLGEKEKSFGMLIKGTKYHSYLTLIETMKAEDALKLFQ